VRLRHIFIGFVLCACLAVAAATLWLQHGLTKLKTVPDGTLVYIEKGSSVHKIAQTLFEQNIIEDPLFFKIGARLARPKGPLKAGEYLMPNTISTAEMIRLLQMGKTHQRRVTIPEGLMAVEIVAMINQTDGLSGEITDIPPEGSLLPETYHFDRGMDRRALITRMQRAMEVTIKELWETRADNLPIKTPGEAIILASIVEKETGITAERQRVAGVFVNRLNVGMALQTDPTVIYAITQGKEKLDRPLYRKDLNIQSPYNTYVVTGLPPGPIANPGRASIAATLQPEEHDYFYFVADGTGGHAFGKTMDDHARNVNQWRKIQRGQK
jgi:UPF0755 protein